MDIFNIFKGNKRLLLFLHEEQIIKIDRQIAQIIFTKYNYQLKQYPQYFAPEIKPFINERWIPEKKGISNKSCNLLYNFIKNDLPEIFL